MTAIPRENKPLRIAAILIAISLPAIILGRAAVAVPLLIAIMGIIVSPVRGSVFRLSASEFRSPLAIFILVVAFIWAMGLFVSSDVSRSFSTEFRSFVYIVLAVPIWAVLAQDEEQVGLCLKALGIATLILGTVAVAALHLPTSFIGTLRANPDTPLTSARILKESASSASLIIPLLVWLAWTSRGRWRLVCVLSICTLVTLVFQTESRSAMAGIVGSVAAMAILYNLHQRDSWVFLISCLGGVLIIGIAVFWLYETRGWYIGLYGDGVWLVPEWLIDPPRQAIWSFAWEAGEPHRWFGVGINVIDKLPGADDWNTVTGTRNIPLHPHNWMVEITIETGVFGLIGLLAILGVFSVKHAIRYVKSGSGAILALAGVWGAYWTSGLFSFSYWSSWWQVSFLVATAICLAGDHHFQRNQKI